MSISVRRLPGPGQGPEFELPPLLIAAGETLAATIMNAEGSLAALQRRLAVQDRVRPEWIWRADHG